MNTKSEMFDAGMKLLKKFCIINNIDRPQVINIDVGKCAVLSKHIGTCAFYRSDSVGIANIIDINKPTVFISVKKCANIGRGGACWSFPGYVIDRTPYGVLQHELGHHIEYLFKGIQHELGFKHKEKPLTGYSPNESEYFAEMFRLFVTNPNLLKNVRPKVYRFLKNKFKPAITKTPWISILINAPERIIRQTERKIKEAGAHE